MSHLLVIGLITMKSCLRYFPDQVPCDTFRSSHGDDLQHKCAEHLTDIKLYIFSSWAFLCRWEYSIMCSKQNVLKITKDAGFHPQIYLRSIRAHGIDNLSLRTLSP
jgi:hypothetical protein